MKNKLQNKLIKTLNTLFTSIVCVLLLNTPSHAVEVTTYYHHDGLGSTVAASDADGNLLWREDYQPYGTRVRNPSNADNNLWYTGKPEEPELGMQYFGARWYDPVAGRFSGIDPVGFKDSNIHSFNRYAYATNNPYRFVDPDGEWIEDAVIGVPSLALGAYSASTNFSAGHYGWLAVDVLGMIVDVAAIATPGIPGGAGFGIAAGRQGSKAVSNVTKGPISVDDALGKAANFMKDGVPVRSIDGKTGVQFIQEFTENGQKITKRAGFDLNPNSSHVKQLGPHLNLQTQINGKIQKKGPLADPHIPIDPKTIRPGDY